MSFSRLYVNRRFFYIHGLYHVEKALLFLLCFMGLVNLLCCVCPITSSQSLKTGLSACYLFANTQCILCHYFKLLPIDSRTRNENVPLICSCFNTVHVFKIFTHCWPFLRMPFNLPCKTGWSQILYLSSFSSF